MQLLKKVLILSFIILILTGCKDVFTVENKMPDYLSGTYLVEMSIKDYGKIKIELYADKAPITVTNFMSLVKEGYYDNTYIHRVVKDFVIQGGQSATKETIKGEFLANGIDNDISHVRGTISMARSGDQTSGYDTGSTQFFIVQKDSTYLDNYYAGFGKVLSGMDVVDKICNKITNVDEMGGIINASDMPIVEYIKEIEK